MRLYFRCEFILYLDVCLTSRVFPTNGYNELKYVYVYIYIHTQICFQFYFCNSNYGLIMTVKAKPVSISCECTCKIIFDGGHYGLFLFYYYCSYFKDLDILFV